MGVLLQALNDLDGFTPAHKIHRDALAWVRSDRTDWWGAFECVCECLGLDASAARAAILAGRGAGVLFLPASVRATAGKRSASIA